MSASTQEYLSSHLRARVAALIVEARRVRNMTQHQLGDKIGAAQGVVSRYERMGHLNSFNMTLDVFKKVCEALRLDPVATMQSVAMAEFTGASIAYGMEKDRTDRLTTEIAALKRKLPAPKVKLKLVG